MLYNVKCYMTYLNLARFMIMKCGPHDYLTVSVSTSYICLCRAGVKTVFLSVSYHRVVDKLMGSHDIKASSVSNGWRLLPTVV